MNLTSWLIVGAMIVFVAILFAVETVLDHKAKKREEAAWEQTQRRLKGLGL